MVNKKITFAFVSLCVAVAALQVGCGDDDDGGGNKPDTSTPDTGLIEGGGDGGDGGGCKFNDFVTGLINNSTTATAVPSTDLGEKCTDDGTLFPQSIF